MDLQCQTLLVMKERALLAEGTVQRCVMCTGGQVPGGPAVWAVAVGSSPDECPACTGRATDPWLSSSAQGGRDQRPGNTAMSHPVAVCKCLFKYEHSIVRSSYIRK